MKKYIKLLPIVLLSLAGCNTDDFERQNFLTENNMSVIKAMTAQVSTRVNVTDDYSLIWTSGDAFLAFEKGNTNNSYVFSTTESGNEARFKSTVDGNISLDYAVYPYSEENPQTITRDILTMNLPASFSYSEDIGLGIPMFGHIIYGEVGFSHLAGVLKIELSNCPSWANSIRLNASAPISGNFTADLISDLPTLSSSSNTDEDRSVTVTFDGTSTDILYIPLPAQHYESINVSLVGNEKTYELESWTDKAVEVGKIYTTSLSYPISDEDIEAAISNAYASFTETDLFGITSLNNYCFGDVAGADANKGSIYADLPDFRAIETYAITPENSYFLNKWSTIYEGVRRTHYLMNLVEKAGNSITNPDQAIAHAKFIKAVWMFEAIRIFGAAVPYVTLTNYQEGTENQVSNIGNNGTYNYIWNLVEQDLLDAIYGLPETQDSYAESRANLWAAKAMLAKLYLYWSSPYNGKNGTANHWIDAQTLLDDIINNGVTVRGDKFSLTEKFNDLFYSWGYNSSIWTEEDVFDIYIGYTTATLMPGASGYGGWGFYQPTYEFAQSFMVDDEGLPLSEANYRAQPPLTQASDVPTTNLSVAVDPRIDFTIGRFGVPFLDWGTPESVYGWVRDFTNGGVYVSKKSQLWRDSDLSYYYYYRRRIYQVIRFADILLMRAECAIQSGDLNTALNYINQVRARAAKSYVQNSGSGYILDDKVYNTIGYNAAGNYRIGLYKSFSNETEARTALEREFRAEFGMEGRRWFDIARWGTASSVLNSYREYENQFFDGKFANQYHPDWVTFPIPSSVIEESNGLIIQNENWK